MAGRAYDGPLWLVCTNGRRDRCCAEIGRPITAALAERWPEATWETTHLGGHRFSGTLLALPSGHTLGRLDVASAVEACAALEKGSVPVELSAAVPATPAEQVRELHVLAGGDPDVDVVEVPAPPRRAAAPTWSRSPPRAGRSGLAEPAPPANIARAGPAPRATIAPCEHHPDRA